MKGTMRSLVKIYVMCSIVFVNTTPLTTYDTIVIGLGSAGTTAASTLAKAGKRVLALEAQDRIGGRVKTVTFGDGVVEEGAEWLHGTNNNRAYESAVRNNVSLVSQDTNINVYYSDGSTMNNSLISDLIEYSEHLENNPPKKPEALGSFFERSFYEYMQNNYPHLLKDVYFISEVFELLNILICSDWSANDWNDISAQTRFESLEGDQNTSWHRHGYKTFFDILLNMYNNGPGLPTLDLKLNKEVTQIKWPQSSTGSVEVVCKDGDVYTADNVIVTVSLGVLKERHIFLFSPPLPQNKKEAIDNISMGIIGKIILSFPERWMRNDVYTFFYLPGDKEKFTNDTWLTKIRGVSTPAGSSNTVTLWSSGDTTKMIESLPENVVKVKSMNLLRHFLGKEMTIPEPTAMIRSTWYSNPFTRGTYTYDSLTIHEYPNAREILGEPLVDAAGNPKVLFAGEATDTTHFATVHGASDSGYREAMRLLK